MNTGEARSDSGITDAVPDRLNYNYNLLVLVIPWVYVQQSDISVNCMWVSRTLIHT